MHNEVWGCAETLPNYVNENDDKSAKLINNITNWQIFDRLLVLIDIKTNVCDSMTIGMSAFEPDKANVFMLAVWSDP